MKLPLSLVIITLNEEANIRRCIESVPFATEIIVVDSRSRDKTGQIAESLGARVVQKEFLGYRAQKQFAHDLATQPWVLSLDADEELSTSLKSEIIDAIKNPNSPEVAFRMPRCSFHLGRWIRHGGWYPDYQTRLYKKDAVKWIGGEVHESVQVTGQIGSLQSDLLHYVFADLHDQIDTNNEFSGLGARQLLTEGKKPSLTKLIFKPIGKFLECFLWKGGFLDGVPGFIIAIGASQSIFLKFAKAWELKAMGEVKKSSKLTGR